MAKRKVGVAVIVGALVAAGAHIRKWVVKNVPYSYRTSGVVVLIDYLTDRIDPITRKHTGWRFVVRKIFGLS